jgi:hypothetical protein
MSADATGSRPKAGAGGGAQPVWTRAQPWTTTINCSLSGYSRQLKVVRLPNNSRKVAITAATLSVLIAPAPFDRSAASP